MYVSFFGLQGNPFSIAPDPRYLYMSERHREALAHLLYGVGGGGGFVLLTGEIGAGKTTVCRCFLEQVPAGCQVAYIFNPKLTVIELLQSVCDEFAIAVPVAAPGAATVKTYIDLLNTHLLTSHAQGRHCVLIIDEAQNLSAEVLEQLRLLTNLETNERKLLQIILIGQPELRGMLAGAGLEQLAQRVIARYHLGALTAAETAAYVAHRLAVAGRQGGLPFDAAALRCIHRLSAGVPRRINLLADRALLGAYAGGQAVVGRRGVVQAAREVFDDAAPRPRWRWLAAGAATAALLVGVGLWSLPALRWGGGAAPAERAASATPAGAVRAASAALPQANAPARSASAFGGLPVSDLPPLATDAALALLPRDEPAAWRELATLWGVEAAALADADPCLALRARQLRCHRATGGTLAQLRQFDRPVWLVLHAHDGASRLARLVRLDDTQATLAAGTQVLRVPLDLLARGWRGEFATLWRPPAGYAEPLQPGARGPVVDALARGLAALRQDPAPAQGQVLAGPLAEWLAAFQVAQSLRLDGIAGPTTFMQLNRAQGVAEPRLSPSPPER